MADRSPAPDTPELRERWGSFAFNEAYEAKAQKALARYPEGRKKSAVMPLLEIVQGTATDDATLATAFATGKALKKTTILVQDSPSFIVNRLLGRFMSEVSRVVDQGTPIQTVDGSFAGVAPMPPFTLIALVGPAIALHNTETLAAAFPDRFYVSPALERVVEARKGAYFAPDGTLDPEVEALLGRETRVITIGAMPLSRARIHTIVWVHTAQSPSYRTASSYPGPGLIPIHAWLSLNASQSLSSENPP